MLEGWKLALKGRERVGKSRFPRDVRDGRDLSDDEGARKKNRFPRDLSDGRDLSDDEGTRKKQISKGLERREGLERR